MSEPTPKGTGPTGPDTSAKAEPKPPVSEGDPKAPDTGDIGPEAVKPDRTPDTTPEPDTTPASDPSLPEVPEGVEAPVYRDPADLKTDRVFRKGEPDLNALSDTSYTASGNRYPLSPEAADNLARNLEGEADRLEHQAKLKRDEAEAARKVADDLSDTEGK